MLTIKMTQDNSSEVLDALEANVAKALEMCGLSAEGFAKRLCPVDTGRLRNSISHAVYASERTVYIGTNVEYAPFVEYGTSRMKAQPYLRPAIADNTSFYNSIIKSVLRGES